MIFYTAFATSAISAILLIAPSAHQLVRAPISGIRRNSMSHVKSATKMAIAGTATFSISVTAVVYPVSSLVFTDPFAIGAAVGVALLAGWAWFYLPLVRFNQPDDS